MAENFAPERIERRCVRCGWRWFQIRPARYPRACPRCRSWRWDLPTHAELQHGVALPARPSAEVES